MRAWRLLPLPLPLLPLLLLRLLLPCPGAPLSTTSPSCSCRRTSATAGAWLPRTGTPSPRVCGRFAAGEGASQPSPSAAGPTSSPLQDGLLLCCKASHYIAGTSPLVLRWRDAHCSSFYAAAATAAPAAPPLPDAAAPLSAVLELRPDGNLVTAEGIVLGTVTATAAEAQGLLPGELLRFGAAGATEGPPGAASAVPQLLGSSGGPVVFLGRAASRRTHADSWSRILVLARERGLDPVGAGPITIDALLDAVSRTIMMMPASC